MVSPSPRPAFTSPPTSASSLTPKKRSSRLSNTKSSLSPLPPTIRIRRPRIVSNKENSSLQLPPSSSNSTNPSELGTSSTLRGAKPRIGGIGRPGVGGRRHHLYAHGRLASVKRAKMANNKSKSQFRKEGSTVSEGTIDIVDIDMGSEGQVVNDIKSPLEVHSAPPRYRSNPLTTISEHPSPARQSASTTSISSQPSLVNYSNIPQSHLDPSLPASHAEINFDVTGRPVVRIKSVEGNNPLQSVRSPNKVQYSSTFLQPHQNVNVQLPPHPFIHTTDPTGERSILVSSALAPYLVLQPSGEYFVQVPGQQPLFVPGLSGLGQVMPVAPIFTVQDRAVHVPGYMIMSNQQGHGMPQQSSQMPQPPHPKSIQSVSNTQYRGHPYARSFTTSVSQRNSCLSPTLRKYVKPIFTRPFSGHNIPQQTQLSYIAQLRQVRSTIPVMMTGQPPMDLSPAEAWKNHPAVKRVQNRLNMALEARGKGEIGPLPDVPRFTTLFPAVPQRYLLGEKGETIWPFHILPWRFEAPRIPEITATNENGIRVPHPYAYNAIVDDLPAIYEISRKFSLTPQQYWPIAPRLNTPVYSFGARLDDVFTSLPFWIEESVYHGGMNEQGKRTLQARGPNICLVVRDTHRPDSPGLFIPINKTVLGTTCANIRALILKGASRWSGGMINPHPDAQVSRRSSATFSDIGNGQSLVPPQELARWDQSGATGSTSALSSSTPSAQSAPIASNLTAGSQDTSEAVPSQNTGSVQPTVATFRINIIPTPDIARRVDQETSPTRLNRNILPPAPQPVPGRDDNSEVDYDTRTDLSGALSVHAPSDMGQSSVIIGETTSESDAEYDGSETEVPSHPSSDDDTAQGSDDDDKVIHPHPLYNKATPSQVDLDSLDLSDQQGYGMKRLPLLPLYIQDAKTFPVIIYHLHHPKEAFTPILLGFTSKDHLETTTQVKNALFALSPIECLRRAHNFHNIVRNLKQLGMTRQATWDQVRVGHIILADVLWYRRALPNPQSNTIAVPYMDGEGLPHLAFAGYTTGMMVEHQDWADMRTVELENEGRIPVSAVVEQGEERAEESEGERWMRVGREAMEQAEEVMRRLGD